MKVVILSDNKPGHYKQSLGIVEKLPECRIEWLEVQFRRKRRDNLLRVFMCIFGGVPLPILFIHALLRWSLTPAAYNALSRLQAADVILSTGSSVAAVNLLLGRLLHAKTVTCRHPSPLGTRHFDLAILPMLSWPSTARKDNVCKTIGVPNPISPANLDALKKQVRKDVKLPDSARIGILLGGNDRHETVTEAHANRLIDICRAIAEEMNVQVLVTTSRRTPPAVTAYLATALKQADWCPLFITPDSPSELADPYQAILALSDLLIITADSFSMVCEAASSGRRVIILTLERSLTTIENSGKPSRARQPKRYQVYRYMAERAIVKQCGLDNLAPQLTAAFTSDAIISPLQDTEIAARAIRCLVANS